MAWIDPLYEERQRKRWLRPDWQRWVRQDADRLLGPAAQDEKSRVARRVSEQVVPVAELNITRPDFQRLRWLVKDLKADLAIRRLRFKYSPDQPRDERGRGTDGGTASRTDANEGDQLFATGERVRLAGEIPTNDPPEIPKDRPASSEERATVVKSVARWLGRWGGTLGKLAGAAYWLYEYDAQITASLDPPKTLEELRDAVSTPRAGYQRHHIVEQTAAEQDGCRRSQIDGPENLVLIPTLKHREITGWVSNKE